jgi:hypothetical protein
VPLTPGGKAHRLAAARARRPAGEWKQVFSASPGPRKAASRRICWPRSSSCSPKEGFIPGWRNERYRIADAFEIERAAARPFGLTTQAVHLNGIAGDRMWLARRSPSKQIDPGMLDNLVAGGISAGFSAEPPW